MDPSIECHGRCIELLHGRLSLLIVAAKGEESYEDQWAGRCQQQQSQQFVFRTTAATTTGSNDIATIVRKG